MENQLSTQPKSNKPQAVELKEEITSKIKDNLNYIYIVLMILANCIVSLLKVENGHVGVNLPDSLFGWILFIVDTLIATFIGVMILNSFRRQGIKAGHECIKDVHDEYLNVIRKPTKEQKPRSLKQYMRVNRIRDSFTKGAYFFLISVFVASVSISFDWSPIISLVLNIVFAVAFGIKAMIDAEEFVCEELVIWYKIKIAEIKSAEVKYEGNECST